MVSWGRQSEQLYFTTSITFVVIFKQRNFLNIIVFINSLSNFWYFAKIFHVTNSSDTDGQFLRNSCENRTCYLLWAVFRFGLCVMCVAYRIHVPIVTCTLAIASLVLYVYAISFRCLACIGLLCDDYTVSQKKNEKLRYREEHSASVVLSWCTLWHLSGDKQQINSYSTTCTKLAMKPTEFCEITQNNGHNNVQGRSRSSILVRIESPYSTSH